ncbi:MAG: hypothetical protein ACI8RD_002852, partial [Bacillariaceae sp.]
ERRPPRKKSDVYSVEDESPTKELVTVRQSNQGWCSKQLSRIVIVKDALPTQIVRSSISKYNYVFLHAGHMDKIF